MQYLILALAFAFSSLLTSALGAGTWQVRKWQFSRGQAAYEYSFSISGREQGGRLVKIPGFTATCSGQAGQQLAACTVSSSTATAPEELYGVSARVKIVVDPENENDSIPRVFVNEKWTTDGG